MLGRILVLLGETSASLHARRFALQLAHEDRVLIVGEARMISGIGANAVKRWLEEKLRQQAIDRRARLYVDMRRATREHDIPFESTEFEGDPIEAIVSAAERCELIVTGHDTAFRGDMHGNLPAMLKRLLRNTPRPVIVYGNYAPQGQSIVAAHDGSLSAMRAIQAFS